MESSRTAKVFCLKDQKSSTYGPPFTMENSGFAIRMIQEGLQQGQAVWAKHPQDFSLFELGEYEPETGIIKTYDNKNCVGLVQDFKTSLD